MKKLNKKIDFFFLSFLFFLFFSVGYFLYVFFSAPKNENVDYINPAESLFGLNIPKDIHFCGESVPANDYSIKANLDKACINPSSAFILIKRSAFWFPVIEPILKKNEIPDDIKYLALAESGLTNSQSTQGAAGFWQFVVVSGQHYGLEINEYVDERYHLEKSTEAACKLLKSAYQQFGSWTLAAAAYNLGVGGVAAQINKQKSKKYYDMKLNKETAIYLYKILALKILIEGSEKKYKPSNTFNNIPVRTFLVDSTLHNLSAFANTLGYSYDVLRFFNPWLLTNTLPNPNHKKYVIRLPKTAYLKQGIPFFEGALFLTKKDSMLPFKADTVLAPADSAGSDSIKE
ncbi:MAG: lytic transglycosylase domain-containing protein [Bacteroidetes bacterium]|nr:lytic transglycosylase domain-containing protein [Bacteroidota bacterium]